MFRTIVAGLLLVLPVSGCAHTPPAITWTDCDRRPALAEHLDVGCGTLAVPLDHNTTGKTISLKLVRVRHREQTGRIGSLVLNPGGPGVAGIEFATSFAARASEGLLKRFDVIGFDPRGVGESAPVRCTSDPDLDRLIDFNGDMRTPAGRAEAERDSRRTAFSCKEKLGDSAQFFNTEATARDVDAIRDAVGDAKLTYAGFSYGAKLGATYAHLFPDKVRALVLDAPSFPLVDDNSTAERQLRGFEEAFDGFAKDCAARPSCAELGDLRALLTGVLAQAATTPLTHENPADHRRTKGGTVLFGVMSALYDSARWQPLEDALRLARRGDGTGFFDLADAGSGRHDGTFPNAADASFVIGCNDGTAVLTDEQIATAAARWSKDFPLFGGYQARGLFGCRFWDVPRHPLARPAAATASPVLVIGGLHDPATPYQGAVDLTAALGNGVLLTWEGEGHTAYLRSECVNEVVDRYLVDLAVPERGRRCQA
ncbi:alpha/beta hydrolase [Lentzea aerocolonigenes]|uniref:alpha/beta hydrolase n=1 Tax=Lentzea aerocolonigenes TaxID=68170 RepID=UPI0004C4368D|nr:alpha/beta hydrolase [Lentzea aerocolonigenes]MCP2249671.1 alpha/beta hydrolase fold [Lentzea aerocolonigenes]